MVNLSKFLVALAGSLVLMGSSMAAALSDEQIRVLNSGIYYFNTEDTGCSPSLSTELSGNDHQQQAFNFFVSKGLTSNQAAGIVGNMIWESGVDPENIQDPAGRSQNPADAGTAGWGIVQWTGSPLPTSQKVLGIAKSANITTPIYRLDTQLEMVWAQLTKLGGLEQQAGNDIKGTTTLEDSVKAFQGNQDVGGQFVGFERPKDEAATLPDRIDRANQVLSKYGSGSTTDGSSQADSSCSSVGPGQSTQYVDGFTVYNQYDASWASKPYGNTTIADAGCGPSAMAMIITTLTGQNVTPDVAARYADQQGLYTSKGSKWTIGPVLAEHWGLKSRLVGDNKAAISSALQSGSLVIVSGRGALPFTPVGHFIVIRGVAADGKWLIGDSGHSDTSTKEWSPDVILSGIQTNGSGGSVYAISK